MAMMDTKRAVGRQLHLFAPQMPSHILPTNLTSANHPFHRWFNFVAGFSPEFVSQCISEANLTAADRILDPFAGCGTTMIQSNFHGIPSVGFEAHEFLAKICRGKTLVGISPGIVDEIFQSLSISEVSATCLSPYSEDSLHFLEKLFPERALKILMTARERAERFVGNKALLGYLILSKVLDLCSHSKTDGIYKAPTSKKKAVLYEEALHEVCNMVTEDLSYAQKVKTTNKAELFFQSSEDMYNLDSDSCTLLVTSPPYLNNFDYAEMTRMYLYFWLHAKNWGEITDKVRGKLIVNTTTALKGHKDKIAVYRARTPKCVQPELDDYQNILREKRRTKAGKKEYDLLIYPYFSQMTGVLRSCHYVLKHNAPVHIIVSDAALYGVHIKTQEILALIMDSIGFKNISIKKLRSRGTRWILEKREGSKDGLGEYHISAHAHRNR